MEQREREAALEVRLFPLSAAFLRILAQIPNRGEGRSYGLRAGFLTYFHSKLILEVMTDR